MKPSFRASPPARQPASPPARQPASPPARQPASPPAGWYVVGVWSGKAFDPPSVQQMLTCGLSEIVPARDLADRTVATRLLTRACFGRFGRMIVNELAMRLEAEVRPDLVRLMDAVLSALAEGEPTPSAVARRLYMARSTLDRLARRTGLVAPSVLVQRTRAVLAVLLRSVPARRTTAWKDLGFYSPGHLSTRLGDHFGVGLREVDRMGPAHWLAISCDVLLRAPMTGLGRG